MCHVLYVFSLVDSTFGNNISKFKPNHSIAKIDSSGLKESMAFPFSVVFSPSKDALYGSFFISALTTNPKTSVKVFDSNSNVI